MWKKNITKRNCDWRQKLAVKIKNGQIEISSELFKKYLINPVETLPDAYSEPCEIFTVKPFVKIVYAFQPLTIFTSSILDVWQSSVCYSVSIVLGSSLLYIFNRTAYIVMSSVKKQFIFSKNPVLFMLRRYYSLQAKPAKLEFRLYGIYIIKERSK